MQYLGVLILLQVESGETMPTVNLSKPNEKSGHGRFSLTNRLGRDVPL